MIIPSIDLKSGSTVQLIGGREQALDAGDPRPILASLVSPGKWRLSISMPRSEPEPMKR